MHLSSLSIGFEKGRETITKLRRSLPKIIKKYVKSVKSDYALDGLSVKEKKNG